LSVTGVAYIDQCPSQGGRHTGADDQR